jgi:hypothetical protein
LTRAKPAAGDAFAALAAGAVLCLAPRGAHLALAAPLARLRASAVCTTPSAWALLAGAPGDFPALRAVGLGGEPTPRALAARWARRVVLLNLCTPLALRCACAAPAPCPLAPGGAGERRADAAAGRGGASDGLTEATVYQARSEPPPPPPSY